MDRLWTICLRSSKIIILILSLSLLVSECHAKCVRGDSLGRGCGCSGPGCITDMGQVIGIICGILGFGIILLVTICCCLINRRKEEHNPNYGVDPPRTLPFTMSRSQWDRNDVQITSSPDASQATKYTLTWSVDDLSGDVPVKAYILKFRRVEVMPDRVYGEYRLRCYLESTDRSVYNLPEATRTHELTGLLPNSFYSLKFTIIYGNIHRQRKTHTFIFKTAEAETEEQSSPTLLSHEYEDNGDPSVTNSPNRYLTEPSQNYHREHIADSSDSRTINNRIESRGDHGIEHISDREDNHAVHSYNDPPPSYFEIINTSDMTETYI